MRIKFALRAILACKNSPRNNNMSSKWQRNETSSQQMCSSDQVFELSEFELSKFDCILNAAIICWAWQNLDVKTTCNGTCLPDWIWWIKLLSLIQLFLEAECYILQQVFVDLREVGFFSVFFRRILLFVLENLNTSETSVKKKIFMQFCCKWNQVRKFW